MLKLHYEINLCEFDNKNVYYDNLLFQSFNFKFVWFVLWILSLTVPIFFSTGWRLSSSDHKPDGLRQDAFQTRQQRVQQRSEFLGNDALDDSKFSLIGYIYTGFQCLTLQHLWTISRIQFSKFISNKINSPNRKTSFLCHVDKRWFDG